MVPGSSSAEIVRPHEAAIATLLCFAVSIETPLQAASACYDRGGRGPPVSSILVGRGRNRGDQDRASKEASMTDDQVDRIVKHLCQQLHVTVRLKSAESEVHPPNLKDLSFDPASVRTILLTGLHWAGVTVAEKTEASEEPPWS